MRARLLRAGLSAALVGGLAAASVGVAQAADDGNTDSAVGKLMEKLGLRAPPDQPTDINYSERSPLVVPPTRDLPPPVAEVPAAAGWPKDAAKPQKRVRSKSAPAAAAAPAAPADTTGALPGQATQAGQAGAPARAPNPPPPQTSWWNPKSWFSHEEYAAFSTEPVREDLTDPPAGYRVPSPDQPYGVGPERKEKAEDKYTPSVTRKDLPR